MEAKCGKISQAELDNLKKMKQFISFLKTNIPYAFYDALEDGKVSQVMEVNDPLYLERKDLFSQSFRPVLFSRTQNGISPEIPITFCEQVLNSNTKVFSRTAKPKEVGSAYLIEGRSLVEDDPSPQIELDEVQQADLIQNNSEESNFFSALAVINKLEPPALLITGSKVNPPVPLNRPLGLSVLGIASFALFAGHCYNPESNPIVALIVGLQSPIFLYLFGTFFIQHLIQLLFALKGGFSISMLPTIFPGVGGLPIFTTSVSIKSPPKNNNDLFDFAFAGPITAFLISYWMIVTGLEATMQISNAAAVSELPKLDMDFLHYSSLTSATIESIMGTNMLLSLGDSVSSRVPCDPLTIAGHVGIIIHAINLLPTTVSNNGGRMSQAALGRFTAEFGILFGLTTTFLAVQAYRGGLYALTFVAFLYLFRYVFQVEMPCMNDVDKTSKVRLAFFAGSTLLAYLALSPA